MSKLTKRFVDSLRPDRSGKDLFYWEGGNGALKGFGVRLKPSGAGAFMIQYRNAEGRTRRMVIGKIGTLTVEEARGLARDRLIAVTKGADPSADRHAVRGAMTVGELLDLYLRNADGRIKPSTLAMDRSRIDCDFARELWLGWSPDFGTAISNCSSTSSCRGLDGSDWRSSAALRKGSTSRQRMSPLTRLRSCR
jgi:hypothetical protein